MIPREAPLRCTWVGGGLVIHFCRSRRLPRAIVACAFSVVIWRLPTTTMGLCCVFWRRVVCRRCAGWSVGALEGGAAQRKGPLRARARQAAPTAPDDAASTARLRVVEQEVKRLEDERRRALAVRDPLVLDGWNGGGVAHGDRDWMRTMGIVRGRPDV